MRWSVDSGAACASKAWCEQWNGAKHQHRMAERKATSTPAPHFKQQQPRGVTAPLHKCRWARFGRGASHTTQRGCGQLWRRSARGAWGWSRSTRSARVDRGGTRCGAESEADRRWPHSRSSARTAGRDPYDDVREEAGAEKRREGREVNSQSHVRHTPNPPTGAAQLRAGFPPGVGGGWDEWGTKEAAVAASSAAGAEGATRFRACTERGGSLLLR